MINLQTERTMIRDHRYEDLPTHHTLFSDKTAMYYLQDIATNTIEESKINLQNAIREIDKIELLGYKRYHYFFSGKKINMIYR